MLSAYLSKLKHILFQLFAYVIRGLLWISVGIESASERLSKYNTGRTKSYIGIFSIVFGMPFERRFDSNRNTQKPPKLCCKSKVSQCISDLKTVKNVKPLMYSLNNERINLSLFQAVSRSGHTLILEHSEHVVYSTEPLFKIDLENLWYAIGF